MLFLFAQGVIIDSRQKKEAQKMDHTELLVQIEELLDRKLEEKLEEKLDQKLDEKLQPINERLTSVEGKVDSLEVKVDSLERKVDSLEMKVNSLEEKVESIDLRLTTVEEDLVSVKKTCFRVENEIIPKLDALYEDRISHAEFNRLSERVENNTKMLIVMRDVIIDHSEEIRCLKEVK